MEKMEKSIDSVKRSFTSVRTGRANAAMLDRIEVSRGGEGCFGLRGLAGWRAGGRAGRCAVLQCCGRLYAAQSGWGAHWCPPACPALPRAALHLPCLQFDYYGAITPLRTVAGISTPEASTLVIQASTLC
jgi:hypothetical protein